MSIVKVNTTNISALNRLKAKLNSNPGNQTSALSKLKKRSLKTPNTSTKSLLSKSSESTALTRFVEKRTSNGIEFITLIIDGTGSMSELWDEVKAGAAEFLNTIHKLVPEMKVSILLYNECMVRDELPPTNDVDELLRFVNGAHVEGGDSMATGTEAVESGLYKYAESNSKLAVLIGDAAANHSSELDRSLTGMAAKGKTIYTVGVNDGDWFYGKMVESFTHIANRTNGSYFGLDDLSDLIDVLTAVFAKKANKVDGLKKLWKQNGGYSKISSKVVGLLTEK
jgi:Mg-chelatase subunit ChlD